MQGGFIVTTKSGKEGFVWHNEDRVGGKVVVHVCEDFKPTGEKLLCDPNTLKINGMVDK